MILATTDLCDAYGDEVRVVEPVFRDFGGRRHFAGLIYTLSVRDDNVLVREMLAQPGNGRVLVVDGGGSLRCALLGDQLATLACENGWSGIVVNGAVRDAEALSTIDVGVKALATCPRRSAKNGLGQRDVPVAFGGVTFAPGDWLAADADGIVVADKPLI